MLRSFVNGQVWLSGQFDKFFVPSSCKVDGNQDYINALVPKYLAPQITIYDVGGGKQPFLSVAEKNRLGARVVGVDIDADELAKAPPGAYDETICGDVARYRGRGDADMVLCQAVLEHVRDVESAFKSIASMLKPGGLALIFVPSRNAVYARLNLVLPQDLKKRILHTVYPDTRRGQGFVSFYKLCTPRDFVRLGQDNALSVVEKRMYYTSSYFAFLAPLYVLWRAWVLLFRMIAGEQAAETFALALRKVDTPMRSSP